MCQTPDGYLWLATFDGLVRFDGVRFTTFNRSNTVGINGNRFGSLFCAVDGDIWAGTEGNGVTQYQQGHFRTYTVRDGLLSNNVVVLSGDDRGKLWALAHGSVHEWHAAGQRFVPLNGEKYRYSDSLTPDGRVGFWGIDEDKFYLFVNGKQSRRALPSGWPRDGRAMAGLNLANRIWLATEDARLTQLVEGEWSIAGDKGKDTLSSQDRDSHGTLWQSEIGWYNSPILTQYLNLPPGTEPRKISFNTLFEDREGNIWLSTDGQGLFRLHTQAIHVCSKEQGLPDRNVYPVYQSRDGTLWFGTWSPGLCRFSKGKARTFTTADGLASNRVNSIVEDEDGSLWIAVDHGLHRMRNGRIESVDANGLISGDLVVRAIHQDPQGVLWFGTSEGLIRFERGRWTSLSKKNGLATEDVRVIISGRSGTLWVGGYGGLSSLQRGQVRAWTEQDGLPSNTIRALYEDADGILWIGTYDGGLGRFENGRFTKCTVQEGLFNNGIFQILEDSHANLWMSCNRGIYRVSKRELNDSLLELHRWLEILIEKKGNS